MSEHRYQESGRLGDRVLTGADDLVRAENFERGRKIIDRLRADAALFRDDFAAIAALLFELATWQGLQLEAVHSLGRSLDAHAGGAPGVMASVADRVADARMLFSAHLIFKALAEHEPDVRMLFDLQAQPPSNRNDRAEKVAS